MLQLVYDYRAVMSPCHTCKTAKTPHYPDCAENACTRINKYLAYLGEKPHDVSPFQLHIANQATPISESRHYKPKPDMCSRAEYLEACNHVAALIEATQTKSRTIAAMIDVSTSLVCNMRKKAAGENGRRLQNHMATVIYKKIMKLTPQSVDDYAKKNSLTVVYNRNDLATPEQSQEVVEKIRLAKLEGLMNKEIAKRFDVSERSISVWLRHGANRITTNIYRKVCG